jgi:hypothetical protein
LLYSLAVVIPVALLMAGVQTALIFALRKAKSTSLTWPSTLMAVLSAALLAAGVLRHYWDIYIHRSVRGISFIFVGIDAAGDLFSLVSVLYQPTLDILGMVIYGTELVLWLGVFALGGYFNFAPWVRMKAGRSEAPRSETPEATTDAYPVGQETSAHGIALHNLPSSTSVFRTPSSEFAGARTRTGVSRSSNEIGGEDISGACINI